MAAEINPAVIKLTQDILGKYVKKPTLSEKLLKKPPFRFLHDVFAVIIRDTGCFQGLYTEDELNSDNIKDRDDKMHFLQKMIDVVRICTNVPLTVKTSKIVAGHEPEKTNELLQLMGKIIEGQLNWKPAVEQVLNNKVPNKSQDNIKVKETKTKESKINKNAAAKIKQSSISKEEKTKVKENSKEKKATLTKEKPLKSNKNEVNAGKKNKETVRPKLTKNDSQNSNKSSSPSKQENKKLKEPVSVIKENECNHEEKSINIEKIEQSLMNSSNEKHETSADNKNDTEKQEEVLTPSELKLNSKVATSEKAQILLKNDEAVNSRKSSANSVAKITDVELKKISSDTEINASLESEKTLKSSESIKILAENEIKASLESVKKLSSPEANLIAAEKSLKKEENNQKPHVTEVRRESTFTRDDSKDIAKNGETNVKPTRPRTSLRPPSARPPSARPGAPRRRDRNVEIILQPNDQVKMSGIQVKLETFGDLEDDGENLVIIETVNNNGISENRDDSAMDTQTAIGGESVEQGHLVQQILETQKELTQQKDINQQAKYEKDSVNGSLALKSTSTHHMNNLRDVIQNLTQSVNPLGKLMDFIPEDIDAMQLEFTMWRDAYTQAALQLKREKSLTESATEPMKNQLVQIEANIVEYLEMIDASRVKISQNNDKILKMLTT